MPISLKIFLRFVVISIIAAVIYGLFLIGSPAKQRQIKFDQQRISDLQTISSAVNFYQDRKKRLPEALDLLLFEDYYIPSLKDPATGIPYEYRIINDKQYELCANFDTASSEYSNESYPKPASEEKWNHGEGRRCFLRETYPLK
ncbi:MAG: hypothetical protein US98_C0010G0004 [Parcubacteria group bacterium GW2011_GWC1_38_6]|nr:MAG: hypothetical protein US98_C0010G0004 [Parcubacteria group bacterium GW2011_GWC1_38_6]